METESMHPTINPQHAIPVYTPQKQNKPTPYMLDCSDWIFSCIAAVLTLFGVSAGIWGGFQAGFTAAYLLLFIGYSTYLYSKEKRIGTFASLCGILSLTLSAVCFVTSGLLVRFFAVCLVGVLSAVWFSALGAKEPLPGELGLLHRIMLQLFRSVDQMPRALRSLFATENRRAKTLTRVILGLLCASPVLCAVIALLVRSDAAFEGLMQHLFDDAGSTAMQILFAAGIFPFLLSFAFSTKKDPDTARPIKPYGGLDTVFLAAFLGVLAVCYLVYLFSQFAYFFSAFSGILPKNYTFSYADYARRGFFELCGIAGINLVVLYAVLLLAKKKENKLPGILCGIGVFIDAFTLLLISTAIAKMILYIREYGVTVLRIGTSAFMVFMAVVFITILLRFFLPKIRVLPVAVITASIIVLLLGIGNIHAFAAWYNYTAFESGKLQTIDISYLRKLGDEGIPYLIRLSENQDSKIKSIACGELCIAIEERYDGEYIDIEPATENDSFLNYLVPAQKTKGGLMQISIPRQRAYKALDQLLKEQPDFTQKHIRDREAAIPDDEPFFGM